MLVCTALLTLILATLLTPEENLQRRNLYANVFQTESKTILTLYNAAARELSGPLIRRRGIPSAYEVRDLLDERPVESTLEGGVLTLSGTILPHRARAFLVRERR